MALSLRWRPRGIFVAACLLFFLLLLVAHPRIRRNMWINGSDVDPGTLAPIDKDSKKEEPQGIDALPPDYTVLKKWEAALPQHNLTLPFPEGKKGRYVKFSNQSGGIGWNNCFNEVLMNAHLAYVSGRGYVFRDYYWSAEHYRWPREKWTTDQPHTPLNAIVSGPVSGGPFDAGDPAPRAISEEWFDVVCPVKERRLINTRDVKPALADASGIDTLNAWKKVLREAPERCIEVVPAPEDPWAQTFDLGLFGNPRVLTLWDSFSQSPISRFLEASPIVRSAVEGNTYLFTPHGPRPPHPAPRNPFDRMLAMHLRRGDYEGHCRGLEYINSLFYSWSLFPHLLDRFVPTPNAPDKYDRFLERCWPDINGVLKKAADSRRDYLERAEGLGPLSHSEATLDVMYILTNEKSAWIDELKRALQLDGWTVATTQDLVLNSEQTDVSMAVDMEIARRAAVFVGNGWSSFTSNIVYERLLDKRDPVTIRFM